MTKETIDKANHIMGLITQQERDIEVLSKYIEDGTILYDKVDVDYGHGYNKITNYANGVTFEDWEVRLMIHQKEQRVKALKVQLDKL